MSLKKRGGTWWIDFVAPNGQRIRKSAGTAEKALAQEYHDRLKTECWRQVKLGDRPRRTWREATVRWLKESAGKATIEMDRTHLRWLDRHLGDKHLDEIDRNLVDHVTAERLGEGVRNGTVNRTLEIVRAILRKSRDEWEWLDRIPKVRMLKEPKRRVRFLTREEAQRLLAELPEHLRDMAAFALATGLRRGNVTGLQWSQVDLGKRRTWIHADQAKARKAIGVPLTKDAVAVLERWQGRHPTHVFCFRGKPITQVSTKSWYAALERAGIRDFRWHDLRHTWASWHVQNETPLYVLQELGGWESPEMVQRYAHLAADHLAPYADRFGDVCSVLGNGNGTNLSQPQNDKGLA